MTNLTNHVHIPYSYAMNPKSRRVLIAVIAAAVLVAATAALGRMVSGI